MDQSGVVAFVVIVAWITRGSLAAWMLEIGHHKPHPGQPCGSGHRRVARGSIGTYAESSLAGLFWLASSPLWPASNFSARSRQAFAI
jgi:hypothetical protein